MSTNKFFKKQDIEKITQATAAAEKSTAAEIVTVITESSNDYKRYTFLAAIIANFVFTLFILVFTDFYISIFKPFFWEMTYNHIIVITTFLQGLIFTIFYLLFSINSLKYLIVPKKRMDNEVRTKAESAFYRHNISATADATGVLIYISFFEHRVELLVDYKIAETFPKSQWQDIVNNIIKGIKTNTFIDAICKQILKIGEMLTPVFPIKPDDINELPDAPIIE